MDTTPIREAIASGDCARATLLWNDYVAAIRQEIVCGTCTHARITEAGDLLEWSRKVVHYQRARAQAQLGKMWVSSRYGCTCCTSAS